MEYSFKKEKKYGFGMNFMMIGIILLVLIVLGVGAFFLMSGEKND